MNHRRIAYAAAAAFAILAAVLLVHDRPRQEPATPPAPQVAKTPAPAPRAAALPAAREDRTELRIFAATMEQQLHLGDDRLLDERLEARLEWLPLSERLVEVRLSAVRHDGVGRELPPRAELERPVLLQLDEAGRLEGLRFLPRTGEAARLLLTALLAAGQFTPGDGTRWEVEEQDGTGAYRAIYERTGPHAVRRSKRGYTRLHERGERVHVEGDASFELEADGGLAAWRATDAVHTRSAAFGTIAGTLEVEARLIERREIDGAALASARAGAAGYEAATLVVAGTEADDAALDRAMDEERAAGATLSGLRRAFAETVGRPRSEVGELRADLVETAGALFRIDPEEARRAGEQLGAADLSDAEANFLAGGLQSAGTREAAHALADAIRRRDATPEARRQAAASLALMDQADATTVAALAEAAQSDDPTVRNTSTLALGSQARVLGTESGGLDPLADLLAAYERATDPVERAMYLDAFGNSGDPRALPAIRQALAEPRLAATAAFALRFIDGQEADALLQAAITGGAPQVRLAAWRAIGYREVEPWLPWAQLALGRESAPQVAEAIHAVIARADD